MRLRFTLVAAALLVLAAVGYPHLAHPHVYVLQRTDFPADGRPHELAVLTTRFHLPLHPEDFRISGAPADLRPLSASTAALVLRAPLSASVLHITITDPRNRLILTVPLPANFEDTFADGTPDYLRLHSEEDRAAFRRWFTTLAEHAADMPDARLAREVPEITDCASLLRYCYRESLRAHDDHFYAQVVAQAPLESQPPALPSVQQWTYPNTPLGAGLFRIVPGPLTPIDLNPQQSAFAQFADAKTLYTLNAYRVSRNLSAARAGDLIFYRLLEAKSQYHSMVITGTKAEWVVYHTGPIDKRRGEMRRVLLSDLLHHPDPRWRPTPQNPNFLGVYRWNILREE